jgi:branched-chain amino acid transport system ATP-binding protein
MRDLGYSLMTGNLSFNFGGLQAVADVSFAAEDGTIHAIIGPNGAGKTTFFNLVSGFLRPSAGRIFLFGQDVTKMSPPKRAYLGLGRTFQIVNIFPSLTVLENLLIAGQSQKSMKFVFYRSGNSYGSLYTKVRKILGEWGFLEKSDTSAQNLSHGEQRQLDLMLALIGEPKLLLLDEPTAGLSRAETATIKEMIRHLSKQRTILMIEHDMEVAFSLAEKITVLHQGRIFTEGSPDEIKADPRVKCMT